MKPKSFVSLLTAAALIFASIGNAIACTSLMITDASGNAYHGRTMEYGALLPGSMTYFPAGSNAISSTPTGKQGLSFDTKFPILALTTAIVPGDKQPFIGEGMNDQGLSYSVQWLNGTSSPTVGGDNTKILSVADFGYWILGNFKNVSEVKSAISSGNTEFWVPIVKAFDPNNPLPQHYAIFDKKGNGIVIEFTNGKINVYDNPVNALTNGPDFPWHIQNLNNYTFTNVDKNTGQLGKLKLATQDAGIALTSLPSAETSQGRFVKAAFYANYVRKAKNPDEAIVTLGHIMNNFDRPYDLTVDGNGAKAEGVRNSSSNSSEVTLFTVMNDLSRNLFYLRTINSLNWAIVDMNKLKDIKQVKSINMYDIDKPGADIFSLFYK